MKKTTEHERKCRRCRGRLTQGKSIYTHATDEVEPGLCRTCVTRAEEEDAPTRERRFDAPAATIAFDATVRAPVPRALSLAEVEALLAGTGAEVAAYMPDNPPEEPWLWLSTPGGTVPVRGALTPAVAAMTVAA